MHASLRNLLVIPAASALATLASAQVIDLDDLNGSANQQFGSVGVGLYQLTSIHAHVVGNFTLPLAPVVQNGSAVYIAHEGGGVGKAITLARQDGSPFSLVALEAGELWLVGAPINATEVEIVGQFAGGGSLTAVVMLDGLADGAGGVEDFQNVHLTGFQDLLSVTIDGLRGGQRPYPIAFDDCALLSFPWKNRGFGLAGGRGIPALVGSGPTSASSQVLVELTNAAPNALGTLFVSDEGSAVPFFGGVLVPRLPIASIPFVTDARGEFQISGIPPIDVFPPGTQVVLQAAVRDPTAPEGVALSNAVELEMGPFQRQGGASFVTGPFVPGGSGTDPLGGLPSPKSPLGIH